MTRVCVWELTAWVDVSCKDVCESITTVVTWKKDIDHTVSKRLDVVDKTRTALVEDEDDRLACLGKGLNEVALVL